MALMCYEHVARVVNPDAHIKKSNYVMYGPTGCGKTELIRRLKQIVPVPLEILDVNTITATGWAGQEKEDLMFELLDHKPDMEFGILVLDEFDKLCMPSYSSHGDSVHIRNQANLLKMIEGTELHRNQKNNRNDARTLQSVMYTQDITFICAGAFTGAFDEDHVKTFGFQAGTEATEEEAQLISEKLIAFGMMPEMAGRIGTAIAVNELTKWDLYEIATQKEDTFAQSAKKQAFVAYGIDISMTDGAVREICGHVYQQKLGARPLQGTIQMVYHNVIKNTLKNNQFNNIKDKKIRVSKYMVQQLLATKNKSK